MFINQHIFTILPILITLFKEPGSSLPLGGVGREPDAVRQSSDIAAFIWQSYLQQGTALRLAESCDQVALSSVLVECQVSITHFSLFLYVGRVPVT